MIINKYILKVPLSESELEVILRDDAFKSQYSSKVQRSYLISLQLT